jgi:hypothetical protein
MKTTHSRPSRSGTLGPVRASAAMVVALAVATAAICQSGLSHLAFLLVERGATDLEEARAKGLVTDDRELGNVITDNLGMIVFGILAIVVLGGLISGLGTTVINWVTKQLGV